MLASDLATALVAAGVATLATDLFVDFLPADPSTAIAVYNGSGSSGEAVMERAGPSHERPHAQIVARATTHATATTNINAAYSALRIVQNTTVGGTFYLSVTPLQSPFLLERDDNDRWIFAFNVEALRAI